MLQATGGGPKSGELRVDPIAVRDLIILLIVVALVPAPCWRCVQPSPRNGAAAANNGLSSARVAEPYLAAPIFPPA